MYVLPVGVVYLNSFIAYMVPAGANWRSLEAASEESNMKDRAVCRREPKYTFCVLPCYLRNAVKVRDNFLCD